MKKQDNSTPLVIFIVIGILFVGINSSNFAIDVFANISLILMTFITICNAFGGKS